MSQLNVDELIVTETSRIKSYTEATKPAGVEGLLVYNSELGSLEIYINGAWKIVGKGRNDGSTPEKAAVNGATLASEYPELPSGPYYIKPEGQTTAHKLWVDIQGTYATVGAMKLKSQYGAYSDQYSSCGGPADGDCSPDTSYPTPYFQGNGSSNTQFVWRDQDDANISNLWLTALQNASTDVDASTTRHYVYDDENYGGYFIQFGYVDGSVNNPDNNGSTWQPGSPSSQWSEVTTQGRRMMTGGQYNTGGGSKIPLYINMGNVANWGWHIRFTSTNGGGYGIWVT